MQIWQSWGKNFEERLKFLRPKTKIDERSENFSRKVVSSKSSFGHVQCSSDNPAKNNFATRPHNFRPKSENDEKKLILQNTRFVKMLLWTRQRQC